MCLSLAPLDVSKQGQDEEDDEDGPESPNRIVAPAGAVRPGGQGADDQNDQNDEYDKTHFGLCLGQPVIGRLDNAKIAELFQRLRAPRPRRTLRCASSRIFFRFQPVAAGLSKLPATS
jgi:hypothetical protein